MKDFFAIIRFAWELIQSAVPMLCLLLTLAVTGAGLAFAVSADRRAEAADKRSYEMNRVLTALATENKRLAVEAASCLEQPMPKYCWECEIGRKHNKGPGCY